MPREFANICVPSTLALRLNARAARPQSMLVEGGYLHSMKQLLEKAARVPDPHTARAPKPVDHPVAPGLIERLLRLATKRT